MTDDEQTAPSTLEVFIEVDRLVGAGAQVLYLLRAGCTPGDILDLIADAADVGREKYRGLVLGVLADADGAGDDFKL